MIVCRLEQYWGVFFVLAQVERWIIFGDRVFWKTAQSFHICTHKSPKHSGNELSVLKKESERMNLETQNLQFWKIFIICFVKIIKKN